MRHFTYMMVFVALSGCSGHYEKLQATFEPATDAVLASNADYETVFLFSLRDGDAIAATPLYVVTQEGDRYTGCYIIPVADAVRLSGMQPGAIIALHTLHKYDTVENFIGRQAAYSLTSIRKKKLRSTGPTRVTAAHPALIIDNDYSDLSVVRCFVQSVPATLDEQLPVGGSYTLND